MTICRIRWRYFEPILSNIIQIFGSKQSPEEKLHQNNIEPVRRSHELFYHLQILYQLVWESHHERDHHQLRHPGQLRALSGRGWVRQQVPDTQGHWRCHICLLCCGNDHKNGGERLLSWSKFSISFRLHWACLDEAVTLQRAGISLTVSLF
mgnify:CR=1 FL=1